VFAHWAPISPVTGRIDAFEWKVPADRPLPAHRQMEIEAWATASERPPIVEAKAVTAAAATAMAPAAEPPAPQPATPKAETAPTEAKADEAKSTEAKVVHEDLMPRAPDDPGPPRRDEEDERYHVF
jgi:HemY protein